MPLVLSLFPGIGLLDMAFEEAGFCVVRGPDLLWGGDVHRFHPPAGRFDGVIGGPPCQAFSRLRHMNPKAGQKHGNLIPEYERVVAEAAPGWFLMENVSDAPVPHVEGYRVDTVPVRDVWVGGGDQPFALLLVRDAGRTTPDCRAARAARARPGANRDRIRRDQARHPWQSPDSWPVHGLEDARSVREDAPRPGLAGWVPG